MWITDYTHENNGYEVGEYREPLISNPRFPDGSSVEPPENPLKSKWEKLYPPTPMPQYSQVCDGYSCMWCDRCPHGDGWKCPEEDKEIYEKWLNDKKDYYNQHGDFESIVFTVKDLLKKEGLD